MAKRRSEYLVHLYSRSEKVRARTGLESTFVPEMITIFGEINLTQYRIFGRRSENFGSGKKSLIQNILQGAKSTIPGTEMGQISIVTRAHNLTQYRRNSGNLTQSGQIMRSLEFYSICVANWHTRTREPVNSAYQYLQKVPAYN